MPPSVLRKDPGHRAPKRQVTRLLENPWTGCRNPGAGQSKAGSFGLATKCKSTFALLLCKLRQEAETAASASNRLGEGSSSPRWLPLTLHYSISAYRRFSMAWAMARQQRPRSPWPWLPARDGFSSRKRRKREAWARDAHAAAGLSTAVVQHRCRHLPPCPATRPKLLCQHAPPAVLRALGRRA